MWIPSFILSALSEMTFKVTVTFDDVHDFENIIDIAEKDHISVECKTAYIGKQFGPCATHLTRQYRQVATFATKSADKFRALSALPPSSLMYR
ncbi:hypothetical protein FHX11_001510 [Rhizobium sp. BK602]|nr:hypothetical protein [Rhizobium sp. BK602]